MSSMDETIVILDYEENKIYVLDYDSNIYHNVEDFFISEEMLESGLSINSCDYMITAKDKLTILFGL